MTTAVVGVIVGEGDGMDVGFEVALVHPEKVKDKMTTTADNAYR
jgi:hypothetical protein